MPRDHVHPTKIFSFQEACEMLPEVQRLTAEACARVEALPGGASSPQGAAELDRIVGDWARALLDKGLEVKGLWLVDFDNGSGYYCWRHPEPALQYFHSYEEGFSGRMRIQ